MLHQGVSSRISTRIVKLHNDTGDAMIKRRLPRYGMRRRRLRMHSTVAMNLQQAESREQHRYAGICPGVHTGQFPIPVEPEVDRVDLQEFVIRRSDSAAARLVPPGYVRSTWRTASKNPRGP